MYIELQHRVLIKKDFMLKNIKWYQAKNTFSTLEYNADDNNANYNVQRIYNDFDA